MSNFDSKIHLLRFDCCESVGVDHDIIDGAPLMRFAERFKQIWRDRTDLLPPAGEREDGRRALET